ncbi:MAG: cysteine--tRNA ligase [Treponema sp. CETP13]|nr:MAG: cysteine--tRNA ligase [Treponema sp. CETP13]
MALRLFNTMSRNIEDFVPIHEGKCGFYGCGPTVYNYAHIGNLRAYVFLDLLDKTLTFMGYDITHVMNITDIGHLTGDADDGEDKMLKTAQEKGESVLQIADFYTKAFFSDIDKLNIRHPDVICKATDHLPEMIALNKRLEENGHTYMAGGNLYFDVTTFPDYGKLARLNLEDLKAGARIVVDKNKRNPCDFVLWFTKSKFEKQALTWDSPWGRGYPGWHIECAAMSMKYLGEHFDIHTGGIDHIPIHHTNEIAEAEGATGKKWVNYWLHNEFLVIAKTKDSQEASGKMSKSKGNFLTLQRLIDRGYSALDYRFFLLGAHYRSQVAFSWEAMNSAKQAREALIKRVAKVLDKAGVTNPEDVEVLKLKDRAHANGKEGTGTKEQKAWLEKFSVALEADLNSPKALSVLQSVVKSKDMSAVECAQVIATIDTVTSFDVIKEACKSNKKKLARELGSDDLHANDPEAAEISKLVQERTIAKKAKDFARADSIRKDLADRGITVTDTPHGAVWVRD